MVKKIVAYLIYGVSALLVTLSIFGSHGVVQLGNLIRDERSLERKQAELSQAVEKSRAQLVAIENDPGELERRARNDLGLSREGEILYIDKH